MPSFPVLPELKAFYFNLQFRAGLSIVKTVRGKIIFREQN
jgi:hypothetical protein